VRPEHFRISPQLHCCFRAADQFLFLQSESWGDHAINITTAGHTLAQQFFLIETRAGRQDTERDRSPERDIRPIIKALVFFSCIEGQELFVLRETAARVFRRFPRHSPKKPIGNVDRSYSAPAVALSQVRRTDGRRRAIHSGTTPTPFSTAPGYDCMKSLAHTPHCRCASEHLAEVCLRYAQTSSSSLRLGSLRPSTRLCTGAPAATPAALTTPVNFYTPRSLHSICISPASAAPAASF
jgi:hypothetical protein